MKNVIRPVKTTINEIAIIACFFFTLSFSHAQDNTEGPSVNQEPVCQCNEGEFIESIKELEFKDIFHDSLGFKLPHSLGFIKASNWMPKEEGLEGLLVWDHYGPYRMHYPPNWDGVSLYLESSPIFKLEQDSCSMLEACEDGKCKFSISITYFYTTDTTDSTGIVPGKKIDSTFTLKRIFTEKCKEVSSNFKVTSIRSMHPFSAQIYPNPSNGLVQISIENNTSNAITSMDIYNIYGQHVYSERIAEVGFAVQKSVDLSHLPSGIYSVSITNADNRIFQKLYME